MCKAGICNLSAREMTPIQTRTHAHTHTHTNTHTPTYRCAVARPLILMSDVGRGPGRRRARGDYTNPLPARYSRGRSIPRHVRFVCEMLAVVRFVLIVDKDNKVAACFISHISYPPGNRVVSPLPTLTHPPRAAPPVGCWQLARRMRRLALIVWFCSGLCCNSCYLFICCISASVRFFCRSGCICCACGARQWSGGCS